MIYERELTEKIIGAAIEVHRLLGPGLLESAYEVCLLRELELRGISSVRQQAVPLEYKGVNLDRGLRSDIIVEKRVVVEVKAVATVPPVHVAQLLTQLRFTKIKVGLILNFHAPRLKDGIIRRVL